MEQRKLIRLGNSSYAIALPKDWVKKSGLKKGDAVFITPNSNGALIISQKFNKLNEEKEFFLDFQGKSEKEITRESVAAYVNGSSLLRIKTGSAKNMNYTKDILNNLVGIEIMEQNGNDLVAKSLIDIETISIKSIIRRIDNTIRNMFEEFDHFIKVGKVAQKDYDEIFQADKDVNKFYFLLWKVTILALENPAALNTLQTDYSSLVHTWWVGINLERTGDNLKRIARILCRESISKNNIKKIAQLYEDMKKSYISTLNSYHKQDKKLALETANLRQQFNDKYKAIDNTKDVTLHKIYDKFQNVQNNIHYISKCVIYFIK